MEEKNRENSEKGITISKKVEIVEDSLFQLFPSPDISLEIVKRMVELKASVNAKDRSSHIPLHLACFITCIKLANEETRGIMETKFTPFEIIKYLVEQKSDLNVIDDMGRTPLHSASFRFPSLEFIKYLVDQKSDVNERDVYKSTPLHLICSGSSSSKDSKEAIKCLVEAKSNLNLLDGKNFTPLFYLCKDGKRSLEMIKYLVEANSSINHISEGRSDEGEFQGDAFELACQNHSLEVIKYLLEAKAQMANLDWNYFDFLNHLHLVCENPNVTVECLQYMVEVVGIDPTVKRVPGYSTTLHLLCENWKLMRKGDSETITKAIKYLLDHKIGINAADGLKKTALNRLCKIHPSIEVIEFMLDSKADVNVFGRNCIPSFGYLCQMSCYNYMIEHSYKKEELDKLFIRFLFAGQDVSFLEVVIQNQDFGESTNSMNRNDDFNKNVVKIEMSEMLERYHNGTLWNIQSHSFFPQYLQQNIFIWLVCAKQLSKSMKQIFPKPVLKMIITRYAALELRHSQDQNQETLKSNKRKGKESE